MTSAIAHWRGERHRLVGEHRGPAGVDVANLDRQSTREPGARRRVLVRRGVVRLLEETRLFGVRDERRAPVGICEGHVDDRTGDITASGVARSQQRRDRVPFLPAGELVLRRCEQQVDA